MECRELAHEDYPCTKRAFHLDSGNYLRQAVSDPSLVNARRNSRIIDVGTPDVYSSSSSPSSTAQSPVNPFAPPTDSQPNTLDSRRLLSDQELSILGPHRTRSLSVSNQKIDKEKRKRSRVTQEQLAHLERFFATDRSPTAARRKEISDLLGMHERQTQIWFQNRRAKAKLQDGKHKARSCSTETPPDTPPELSTGFEVDLHNLIHEDEPVTVIPCTDLTIGSWRRIATTVGKHDLVAYVCDTKRCLTWFIHSGGYGFKMEIPFEFILETEFANAAPGTGLASFALSQPPMFYLETVSSPLSDGSVIRDWKRCADWTEGHQATKVLRHDLVGSAVQLAHLLRNLQADAHGGANIVFHSLPDNSNLRSRSPCHPMALPQLPMAVPMCDYPSDTSHSRSPVDRFSSRKRMYSGLPAISHPPSLDVSSAVGVDGPAIHTPSNTYPSLNVRHHHGPGPAMQSSQFLAPPLYSEYPEPEHHHHTLSHQHPRSSSDDDSIGISQDIAPCDPSSFIQPPFYEDEFHSVALFQGNMPRRHSSSAPLHQQQHQHDQQHQHHQQHHQHQQQQQHYLSTPSPPVSIPPYAASDGGGHHRDDGLISINNNNISPPPQTSGGRHCESDDGSS